ncbi:hypothetical protein WR25_08450 isoform B [Diploscapter pachys]|uniref:LTD domain-containing protein n=1 Tax=Diploscapter pachys TaxID=2018661 RepID=A0A2A2LZC7_9BILA|nr:hypothetical protein WR25_08450 isoform B [Diploscapter pachys]
MEYTSMLEEKVESLEKERDDLLEQLKKMNEYRKEEKAILMEEIYKKDKTIEELQDTLRDSEETIRNIHREFATYKTKSEEKARQDKSLTDANLSQLSLSEKSFVKGETRFRGNICISACEPSGKYIILENTSGAKDEDISGFQIEQYVDNHPILKYDLPLIILRVGKSIKV